jgi:hypothetical protein
MIDAAHRQFLLERAGAGLIRHSGRSLYEHLCGTHDLLEAWGNSKPICDGGLFHSVYGTASFKQKAWPISDRITIQKLIGSEAELMVYVFCTSDRRLFLSSGPRALREIEAANLLEQGSRGTRLRHLRHCDISRAAGEAIRQHLSRKVEAA